MGERLVVCFRRFGVFDERAAADYLATAESLRRRAEACGGRLCAWHATSIAFDFGTDSLEDAIELVTGAQQLPPGYAVAIASGELQPVFEPGTSVALGWGDALVRAAALSRVAAPGEVVVDPEMPAVLAGDILTVARVRGVADGAKFTGRTLDRACPLRRPLAARVRDIATPPHFGAAEVVSFPTRPGQISILRAAAGAGGTRFLAELVQEVPATLFVAPGAIGEPLGGLRRALVYASTKPKLFGEHAATYAALYDGQGAEPEAAAAMLGGWLVTSRGPGFVLVDDAALVDHDTLDAVAVACTTQGLVLVVRLGLEEALPTPLAAVPVAGEAEIQTLAPAQSAELARHFLDGALDPGAAARWVRRLPGHPLALRESLSLGLELGELAWDGTHARIRAKRLSAARGTTFELVGRRLRWLSGHERIVLAALAILGGDADFSEFVRVVERVGGPLVDLDALLPVLAGRGWIVYQGAWLKLRRASQQRLILDGIDPEQRTQLHRAAARVLGQSERPLAAAAAALHAALAGDSQIAGELARRAAAAAIAAGLGETADALEHVADEGGTPLMERGLAGGWDLATATWSRVERAGPALSRARPVREEADDVVAPASVHPPAALIAAATSDDAALAPAAVQAIKQGDLDTVERIARETSENNALADRLGAMAALGRGETGDALRLARRGVDRSRARGPAERSRASLAHAVVLAAAGRSADSLLEALEGLARAREATDRKGEIACTRFLAQLAQASGHADAAGQWSTIS